MRRSFAIAFLGCCLLLGGCSRTDRQANASQVDTLTHLDSTAAAAEAVDTTKMPAGPAPEQREVEPVPAPGKAPAQIRGIYLNAYNAGSRARLAKLIAIADST